MRKLKLQMHMSLDGFVATTNDEGIGAMDEEFRDFSIANLDQVDCIILGRTTARDLITYWASVAEDPNDRDFLLAKRITDTPKVVFSKTLASSEWANTTLAKGEIVDEINKLKQQAGNDIIVYGGARFVSSLVKHGLIDEYDLAINPLTVGSGLPIFRELNSRLNMTLIKSKTFASGIVLLQYAPRN